MIFSTAKKDPLLEKLLPESDVKVLRSSSGGFILAISLCFLFASLRFAVPEILFPSTGSHGALIVVKMDKKQKQMKKSAKQRAGEKPGKSGAQKKSDHKQVTKRPTPSPYDRGILREIVAKVKGASAYDFFKGSVLQNDLAKVLATKTVLRKTGQPRIAAQRGKFRMGVGPELGNGGEGECGIDCLLDGILDGGSPEIITKIRKTNFVKSRNIDWGKGFSGRSKASIMKVIRARTPGLRHSYTRFLKRFQGFSGKVTIRFVIAPGGKVISATVVDSSTGVTDFDEKIRTRLFRWKFGVVKAGNTIITVPFTFSE